MFLRRRRKISAASNFSAAVDADIIDQIDPGEFRHRPPVSSPVLFLSPFVSVVDLRLLGLGSAAVCLSRDVGFRLSGGA
ncbi:hypothetical protein MLD38_034152 [Melastoma candidum]|uniref:Uncharacterized protein n=1 Tax=Melastoma candidum TaxID=119954 RepID=A0ACB9M8P4_9MYRT|nr:hypothetical protein MLD38_034152 [Melastoma candidum]